VGPSSFLFDRSLANKPLFLKKQVQEHHI